MPIDDAEFRRAILELKQNLCFPAGELSLSSTSSTTTITRIAGVSASSIVSLTPYNAGAKTEGIPQVVPASGQFVITHTSTTTARTYRYVIHTPQ